MLSLLYDAPQCENMMKSRVAIFETSLPRSIKTMGIRILSDKALQHRSENLRERVAELKCTIVSYIQFITNFVDRVEKTSGPSGRE